MKRERYTPRGDVAWYSDAELAALGKRLGKRITYLRKMVLTLVGDRARIDTELARRKHEISKL